MILFLYNYRSISNHKLNSMVAAYDNKNGNSRVCCVSPKFIDKWHILTRSDNLSWMELGFVNY